MKNFFSIMSKNSASSLSLFLSAMIHSLSFSSANFYAVIASNLNVKALFYSTNTFRELIRMDLVERATINSLSASTTCQVFLFLFFSKFMCQIKKTYFRLLR